MVFALLAIAGVGALLIIFKDQIKNFLDDVRKPKTEQEVERMERGAVENTQAFILGEEGLANLKETSEANKLAIDKFLKEADQNIKTAIAGINPTLQQAEKQLTTLAETTQQGIIDTAKQASQSVQTTATGVATGLDELIRSGDIALKQFGADVNTNLLNIQSFFGGQKVPKAIATSIPIATPKTTTQKGSTVDLSFLTPNTSFTTEIQKVPKTRSTRFS